MTEWVQCDDCEHWTDTELVDRFRTKQGTVLVCKECSQKRRAEVK